MVQYRCDSCQTSFAASPEPFSDVLCPSCGSRCRIDDRTPLPVKVVSVLVGSTPAPGQALANLRRIGKVEIAAESIIVRGESILGRKNAKAVLILPSLLIGLPVGFFSGPFAGGMAGGITGAVVGAIDALFTTFGVGKVEKQIDPATMEAYKDSRLGLLCLKATDGNWYAVVPVEGRADHELKQYDLPPDVEYAENLQGFYRLVAALEGRTGQLIPELEMDHPTPNRIIQAAILVVCFIIFFFILILLALSAARPAST